LVFHGLAVSLQVIVSPLVRLTNQKGAKIEDIGNPEAFLSSVGPFITGTYLDLDDVVSAEAKQLDDGLTYYYYDVYATYGLNGPHTLTACTVKGDLALLFCLSANDKQYARSKKKLNTMLQTFRA
jgi:PsbP